MTKKSEKSYQTLKTKLLPLLYEDKNSLFYQLAQKKLNLGATRKNVILSALKALNKKASFFDIVSHLISKGDENALADLIMGERVSSSKKALIDGYDCCQRCKRDTPCGKTLSSLESAQEKTGYLLYLRYIRAKKALNMLRWGYGAEPFTLLLKEPMLLKFVANYALVVDTKNELKKEGKIATHKTLYKGAGKYCPFDDFWELA